MRQRAGLRRRSAQNSNGIFQLEWPAAALFSDFDQLCVRATREYYDEIFGEQFKPESVFPLAQLLARQSAEHDAFRALHRFLQGNYRIDRPLYLPAWQSDDPPSVLKAAALDKELRDTRQQMLEAAPGYIDLYAQYAKAVGNEVERCREELKPFELLAGRRLLAALRLLEWPAVAAKVERAEWWQQEVARLLPLVHILNEQVTRIGELEFGNRKFAELFQRYSQNSEDEHVKAGIRNQMATKYGVDPRVVQGTGAAQVSLRTCGGCQSVWIGSHCRACQTRIILRKSMRRPGA